jgi:hypothetical protein
MVGAALKWLPGRLSRPVRHNTLFPVPTFSCASRQEHDQADPDTLVPWHRVINSSGKISLRGSPAAEALQAELLRNEGVEVSGGGRGTGDGGRISLTTYGWFPALPNATSSEDTRESEAGPTRRRGRR